MHTNGKPLHYLKWKIAVIFQFQQTIEQKGELIIKAMQDYTLSSFNKLFEIEEFGFIIRFIFQNHLE